MRLWGFASILTALFGSAPKNEVCFHDVHLGCFTSTLSCHTLEMASPEVIDTRFSLFTPTNPTTAHELKWRDRSTIRSSSFNSTLDTKFIIHGWLESGEEAHFVEMRNTIMARQPVNVIMVNWNGGSLDFYDSSVQNTRVVGREIAKLARELREVAGASYASMHLIGHSLGAHTAGYAGSELDGLGRITGLDPAGPSFRGPQVNNDCRLDPTDAMFVDVIHTDGTNISSVIQGMHGLGLQDQVGHQDFYPNGGEHMPGCMLDPTCSHYMAVYYFTESVSVCPYPAASRCASWGLIRNSRSECMTCDPRQDDCPRMGYWADPDKGRGAFYLETTATDPYC